VAYIYQADLWCNDCAELVQEEVIADGEAPDDPDDENSFDSDEFPKGPYSDNDPADSPSHCAAGEDCLNAVVLDDGRKEGAIVSGLTDEGRRYVLEARDSPCVRLWREHFEL
jgi:hypothetical protein